MAARFCSKPASFEIPLMGREEIADFFVLFFMVFSEKCVTVVGRRDP